MEKKMMAIFMIFGVVVTFFLSFYSLKTIGDITGKTVAVDSTAENAASSFYIILILFFIAVFFCIAYYFRKGRGDTAAHELNKLNMNWLNPPACSLYHN